MPGNNPVLGRINKDLQKGYAGFGGPTGQRYEQYGPPTPVNPRSATAAGAATGTATGGAVQDHLEDLYRGPSAGPVETDRLTLDDVVMKTLTLFGILLVAGAVAWFAAAGNPRLTLPMWMVGMFGGLVLGFVIAFKKTVSVPLIVGYAALEGLFLGAFSEFINSIPRYSGIVATAVVATVCTFAGMFAGYRAGIIKVTSKSRRFFALAVMGYALFSLVQLVFLMAGWTQGWGFGGSTALGLGISILGVGLAAYSLAVDFDSVDQAISMGAPRGFAWLLAHGLIVSLVWLYVEIVRLLARARD